MKYRTLGKTNLRVSVIGVGTWQFGGEWGHDFAQNEVDAILDTAAECGLNLIDTAECYGDHLSESLIGDYLSRRNREDWVVATKFGHIFHSFLNRTDAYDADSAIKQLDDSLRALQADCIDLLQFHSGAPEHFKNDALWEALGKAKAQGKIRHLGASVSKGPLEVIDAAGGYDVETIQIIYNRLDRDPEAEALPRCRELNLGVLARVPLASGFLTGKYKPGDTFAENDVRHRKDREQVDARLRDVERIQREEVPEGTPMCQWALAWCLQHDAVSCTIPGCKTPDQVRGNAAAAELPMVRDDHPQACS